MQVFVCFVASMHSFGIFLALTGLIISRLKESDDGIEMSRTEGSWFGKAIHLIFN